MFIGTESAQYDKNFLKKIDQYPLRDIYAKIISLDWDEHPIEEISGNITGGSISIDGSSATRRTCSLNILTDAANAQLNKINWGLNTKFAVLIGLKNYVDKSYPKIIWFQQGIFIITSFSQTSNTSGNTISIQGKDKMCMLDGTVGGQLFADHDFGKIEIIDEGAADEYTSSHYDYITIDEIVRNIVHTYALEPYENIVINDLDDVAVELLDYRLTDKNLFIYDISINKDFVIYTSQMAFEGIGIAAKFKDKFKELWPSESSEDGYILHELEPFELNGIWYRIVKEVTFGDTAGYRRTDLTYAGDLVLNAGSAVSGALDKIVEQLGEFEYFYDIYGKFIFQRKRIYHNIVWNGAVVNDKNEVFYNQIENTANVYEFSNAMIVDSFSNRPTYTNIRNDFICWGKTSTEAAIHLRYAIDDKPTKYTSLLDGITFVANKEDVKNNETLVDWRELIYRMARDNARSQEFIYQLTLALNKNKMYHYDSNKNFTYSDCLYYNTDDKIFKQPKDTDELNSLKKNKKFLFGYNKNYAVKETLVEEIELWQNTWNTGYDCYYADMLAFWHLIYDMRSAQELEMATDITNSQIEDRIKRRNEWIANGYWNPDIINYYNNTIHFSNPEGLLFWIDFIGAEADLNKYKMSIIGRRPEVVNDDSIKAIFFRDTPEVLFIDPTDAQPQNSELNYVKLNLVGGLINYFTVSSQSKSAKEKLDATVYEKTYYQETITISCLPIYYLEPNTRIKVIDSASGINGNYIVKSFNIPLEHSGTMSITATKLADRIL